MAASNTKASSNSRGLAIAYSSFHPAYAGP